MAWPPTEEHTFQPCSRSCKLQSTNASFTAKSSNRTAGESPCSCHATRDEHTFHLCNRTCKLQSTKATSTAKSNDRTPGETLQKNMSSASIVEVASSRVLEHLPLPNPIMEQWVNPRPNCADADKYTSCLYSRSCKLQSAKHLPLPNLALEFQDRPCRRTHHHLYSRGYKFQVQKHLQTLNLAVELSEIH